MKNLFKILSFLTICALTGFNSAQGKNFEFLKSGQPVKSLSRAELGKLSPESAVTVLEPHLKKDVVYLAANFRSVLDQVYGPDWIKAKSLIFTCTDGFKPVVEVQLLLKGQPWLAFAAKTGKFEIQKGDKQVILAPAYLVWSQKTTAGKDSPYIGINNWPYQVESFNLVP